ncbi:hypothetical protein DQQ10_27625 [Pseudochryseolinea flava]|uniref:Uncharacterized protein n=1 Tax=Pseudochryseolinea flava TaxID=2059302 RepID=A0A364XTX3_9BACT|nr:hypothetical protein DQQ10_27625 [Pseudochryseolinea flava]
MPKYDIQIKHKAKPTNLLSSLSGFYGLTIDDKFKDILQRFNLPPHQFYPVNVTHRKVQLSYYWFHFVNSFLDYIDFTSSVFETFTLTPFNILNEFKVSSIKQLHALEREANFEKSIRPRALVLKENFPGYDIISLSNVAPLTLV